MGILFPYSLLTAVMFSGNEKQVKSSPHGFENSGIHIPSLIELPRRIFILEAGRTHPTHLNPQPTTMPTVGL